jgi:hypothetical protein
MPAAAIKPALRIVIPPTDDAGVVHLLYLGSVHIDVPMCESDDGEIHSNSLLQMDGEIARPGWAIPCHQTKEPRRRPGLFSCNVGLN